MNGSGVYAIECAPTGERYIGSAVVFRRRWDRHRTELRRGRHHSWKLQRAWNAYGELAFRFFVIDSVQKKEDLVRSEQLRLDEVFASGKTLNVLPTAGSPLGSKQTEATKAKKSASLMGHSVSVEMRNKLRIKATGRQASDITKIRMRETWAKKRLSGPIVSEETRAKRCVEIERVCLVTGTVVRYSSIKAVRVDGFLPSCVSNVLAGRHQSHRKFFWRYTTTSNGLPG